MKAIGTMYVIHRQDDKGNLYFKKASSHAISRALQVGIAYDCLKAREEAREENVVLNKGNDSIIFLEVYICAL